MIRHMHGKLISSLGIVSLGAGMMACAHAPAPPELLDARTAYTRAESGAAAQYKPDQLHEAKVALDRAERSYIDDPGKQKTRDLAYVAERRAELAEVQGRDAKAATEKTQAEQSLQRLTQEQLSTARSQLNSAGQQLAGTQQALVTERTARAEAEKRAHDAMDKLAASAAASVKQEARGTVITIPGSVLFASAKSMLLSNAQAKLVDVAEALKNQEDRQIVVEGHTDSQGSDAFNQELSRARAQSVRDFLVSHGIPSERVRAEGYGPSRPVADNGTTEGRANNRRVEIIVQPAEVK
jgi:outer membrane protein OmpA-like peptidoglycan-associated protein